MKDIKYFLCCFLLLTLTKCVSNLKFYEGPELPKEEIATIDSYYWHIYQIDDKPAGNSQKGYDLLSGFHLIYFEGNTTFVEDYYKKKSTSTKGRGKIGVQMKAGHFYRLSYNQDPDKPNSVITPCIIEYRSSTSDEKLSVIFPESSGYLNTYSESKITTTNQQELAKIAKNDKYTNVREAAVEKLTDQAVLAYVAKNDKDNSVRQTATEKLTDQAALAEIAKNDEDNHVRSTAVYNPNFSNQTLLAELAKNDKDTTVRAVAVGKITDKVLLADIFKNDIDKYVRSAVVENPNFTDQAVLADIAKNDKESNVRTVAVGKITDKVLLADIAKNDKDKNVRSAVVENPNFTDQAVLAGIAKNDKDEDVRKASVKKLTDKVLLADIAKNDEVRYTRSIEKEMILIPGGTFQMGSNSTEAFNDEKTIHTVTVSSFYMSKTEVTQGLWKAMMGSNPSSFKKGDTYPVERVSWDDCQEFIRKLNAKTGKQYRLPTEAEWEYACRAGTTEDRYGNLDDIAWYDKNSDSTTHPVGQKQANAWGLYDMLGNMSEWCSDWYDVEYYHVSPANNPTGPASGSKRAGRGGSWVGGASGARASDRGFFEPGYHGFNVGFRLASGSANGG